MYVERGKVMVYKCLECGHIFESGEQAEWQETHGLDCPPYERWSGCPICKGGYEETEKCRICGGEFLPDELECGACEGCVSNLKFEYKHNFKKCFSLSAKNGDKQKIEINGFLACMFTKSEIEEVLMRELFSSCAGAEIDCTPYIEADENWFIENAIKEEVGEGE